MTKFVKIIKDGLTVGLSVRRAGDIVRNAPELKKGFAVEVKLDEAAKAPCVYNVAGAVVTNDPELAKAQADVEAARVKANAEEKQKIRKAIFEKNHPKKKAAKKPGKKTENVDETDEDDE